MTTNDSIDYSLCPNCKTNPSTGIWMAGTPVESPDMCEDCYNEIDEMWDFMSQFD